MRFIRGTRWRFIAVFVVPALLIAVTALMLIEVAPAGTLTVVRIVGIRRGIFAYALRHNRLPQRPEDVAADVRDEWGHPMAITIAEDGTVTMTSYGRDGRPGGDGKDQDIVGSFIATQVRGHWNDADPTEWVVNPADALRR